MPLTMPAMAHATSFSWSTCATQVGARRIYQGSAVQAQCTGARLKQPHAVNARSFEQLRDSSIAHTRAALLSHIDGCGG